MNRAANDNGIVTLINSLSATLSNIDIEYEFELARIRATARPDLKALILNTVRQRHLERREPYVRHLAELRKRVQQR
jgi:hypothetical protein